MSELTAQELREHLDRIWREYYDAEETIEMKIARADRYRPRRGGITYDENWQLYYHYRRTGEWRAVHTLRLPEGAPL